MALSTSPRPPSPFPGVKTENVDAAHFRDAMARLAAAVHVVTTLAPDGKPTGFTATAVCSVSDTPPSLLVCLNRGASVSPAFQQAAHLCVNTLEADQQALSNLFGGKTPMVERFAGARWGMLSTGAPALDDALMNFDCHIAARSTAGTHDILICQIVALRSRKDGCCLVYADRRYHTLAATASGNATRPQ